MRTSARYLHKLTRAGLAGLLACWSLVVVGSTPLPPAADATPEFQFVRLAYTSSSFDYRRRQTWLTDAPEAEEHFLQGVKRLTRLNSGRESVGIKPADPHILDYPFLYAVEVGHWDLSEEDAASLREHLLRGGFLMVDDFHGTLEWENFLLSLRRIFPDRPVVDIADDHEVFHVLFDLDQRVQIPGSAALRYGVTYEKDGYNPHWRGVLDDDGRLMIAINFNMDLGDAWELADLPYYPQPLTALAYRFGINYVLYAMTH